MKEKLINQEEKLLQQMKENRKIYSELVEEEKVKEYLEVCYRLEKISHELEEIELKKIDSCKHLYVIGYKDRYYDGHRWETDEYLYCIKCGLNSIYTEKNSNLTKIQKHMQYLCLNSETRERVPFGIKLKDVYCDPSLAAGIYNGIIKAHSDISDEELVKYFKVALNSIQNKPKTESVKKGRVKRLNL